MTLPIVLIGGVLAAATSLHFPVSTSNTEASAAMDRGLFLYYAYNRGAARRSFAAAATSDPRLAMAYWGIALADGPDLNTPMTEKRFEEGRDDIAAAVARASSASERERRYVGIMARRFAGNFSQWQSDDAAYASAMVGFARDSGDENARLLAAETLLEQGGLQWSGSALTDARSRDALAIVEAALRDDPANAMANHLCLHLYDLAPNRSPALRCAQRLDAAAFPPEAEHLAHMPAHFWIETGDYAAAVHSSDRAYALILQLQSAQGESAHVEQYIKHDVAVGYSATMMLDDYGAAKAWAQRMASAYGVSFDAITALRFGNYAAAYAASDPQWGNPAVRGWAALLLGNRKAAAIAAAALQNTNSAGYITPLFLARVAEAGGDSARAKRSIAQAADEQHRDFGGELVPLVPASEALGELELRAGDPTAAAAAFEQTLALYPNDPRADAALKEIQTGGASAVNAAGFP